jgi:hypothetical protein
VVSPRWAFKALCGRTIPGETLGCVLGWMFVLQRGNWGRGVDGAALLYTFKGFFWGDLLRATYLSLKYFSSLQKIDPHDPQK